MFRGGNPKTGGGKRLYRNGVEDNVSKLQIMSHVFLFFLMVLAATDQSVALTVTMVTWVFSLSQPGDKVSNFVSLQLVSL